MTKEPIRKPEEVFELVRSYGRKPVEYFGLITLNGANIPIRVQTITKGILNRCLVHPREVFRPAIVQRAGAIIAFHNHPSGNTDPSPEDIETAKRLESASSIIGIPLLDQLIVCRDRFVSLKEKGLI